jgi:hypothetical protein
MENNIMVGKLTSSVNKKEKGITKSEVETLMPKACVVVLQHVRDTVQNVLRDGEVTAGERWRVMKVLQTALLSLNDIDKQKSLKARGVRLGSKARTPKTLDAALESQGKTADVGGVDLEF